MTEKYSLNLLTDIWLPVRLQDDTVEKIKISEIGRDDIIDIVSPRADFRGAIYQLLIGVLQTAFAPEGRKAWIKNWKNAPSTETLDAAFAPFQKAFNINAPVGEPAFMQDLDLAEGENKNIAVMFIEAPGGKTLKDNQDHFIKRGDIESLSPVYAALALFTLQINAPSGGVGHRVSLRGGGPLTTLVLPPESSTRNTLWHRLWLNILTHEETSELPGNSDLTELKAIFPWMDTTRVSEKKGMETFPEHVHPLQAYWSMPRRMRLHFSEEDATCDLTSKSTQTSIKSFHTKNYGVNYSGNWIHPLTPYAFEQNNEPRSIKAQPGGLGYRHWLGLVAEAQQGKLTRSPAIVVQRFRERQDWINSVEEVEFNPQLWAFGYDMDNMKARCWYEAEMPVFSLGKDEHDDITDLAQKMINAATDALKILKSALKKAWFKRPKDAKGDISFIDANYWSSSEPAFYLCLRELVTALDDEEKIDELLDSWKKTVKHEAQVLFDQYALSNLNEDGDLKRVIKARDGKGGLQHYLNGSKALKASMA